MNDEKFDFQSFSEQPEEFDYNKLLPCPHCQKPIPHDSTNCLYCSESVYFNKRSKPIWVIWTAAVLIIILAIFFLI